MKASIDDELNRIKDRGRHNDEADRRTIEAHRLEAQVKRLGRMQIDLVERAWAAGFFDGEGHASARQKSGEFHCNVEQIDIINLERFWAAVGGVGRISLRKQRPNKNAQQTYIWSVTNQDDLKLVAAAIGPYLSPAKSRQFARALSVPLRTILQQDGALPPDTRSVEIQRRRNPSSPKPLKNSGKTRKKSHYQ